jgi:isocitrate dehydrogenase kinase/phosphatase
MTMLRSKRDFGTLDTEAIVDSGLAALNAAHSHQEKSEALAGIIIGAFDNYFARSERIPWLAKQAFETRAWKQAIDLSQERIAIFSTSLSKLIPVLEQTLQDGDRAEREAVWPRIERLFHAHMSGRYEADLAFAYLAAIRRALFRELWAPLAAEPAPAQIAAADIVRTIAVAERVTPDAVERILAVPGIAAPFRDRAGDAELVARRINDELRIGADRKLERIEIIDSGFYRNRGAYIVGAITVAGETGPLALALLNREHGIEVDAVILRRSTLTHVFSSTLANFHVTQSRYHELADYLFKLMPSRPRGLQYTTIGYNHVGKVTVMRQITEALNHDRRPLEHARGPRGSVAIAFTSPEVDLVLKVIRDRPSASYKWARFAGPDSVLAKYRRVHELNRSGSMLDNIIYSDIALPRSMFGGELLEDLALHAAGCVTVEPDQVLLRHLIVQRKVVPLPIYLAGCAPADAEMAVIRLGQCIRNNAAINVFNRDFDGRNYGVSSLRFVYLFDYDAIDELTQVKVRTNADREPGEEEPPDWFFEDGEIFLPEELELHLQLPTAGLRRLFREAHGELLTAAYWRRMQSWLKEGRVPRVRTYPRGTQLRLETHEPNLTLIFPN